MNTWKVILATIVIFGAGVVTGGLLVRHTAVGLVPQRAFSNPGTRGFPSLSAGGVRIEFLRRAERELNLTPDQRNQIDQILAASQERTRKLMEPLSPKIREELEQTKDQFIAILTPLQRARFEELLKQQHQQQHPRDPHRSVPRPPESSSLPNPTGQPASKP